MTEKKEKQFQKRKDWIKNFAIIFLVVLLILTFFSNTIMNYSLPQVAVQYVTSGSITAKIRGTGTVESGDPYNVMVKQTRKVQSLSVRVGDKVSMGDVLLTLEDGDSAEIEAAQAALDLAQDNYNAQLLTEATTAAVLSNSLQNVSADAYRAKITAAQNAVDAAQKKYDEADKKYTDLTNKITLYGEGNTTVDTTAETAAVNDATKKLTEAQNVQTLLSQEAAVLYQLVLGKEEVTEEIQGDVSGNDSTSSETSSFKENYDLWVAKAEEVRVASDAVAAAQKVLDDAQAALIRKQTSGIADPGLAKLQKEQTAASVDRQTAGAALDTAKSDLSELVGNISSSLTLTNLREQVADARADLEKAMAAAIGGEVLAPISGTVTAINAVSGKELDTSDAVVVLQPEGQGYTMSFSVTNDQARRLSVGDTGEMVNSWWYSDVQATVSSIKPDKADPNKSKTIKLDLTGESIVAGQSITISLGSRSSSYDLVVPNSAIREDNNGKFLLVVTSKPSPLGNRYFATRYDVEVIANDDTMSAVSGALYGNEYIITTSTKPISAGDQVRLADETN